MQRMKPVSQGKYSIVIVVAAVLLTMTTAFSQGRPQLPQLPPQFGLPNGGGGRGTAVSQFSCSSNTAPAKTAFEQLMAGAMISEVQQNETRAMACKVNLQVVEVIASGFGATLGQEYESAAMVSPGPSIGSGVIVSADGYIMTNRHVIKGAPRITVVLHFNGKPDEQVPAEFKGGDERTDLALIKIEKTGLPFFQRNPTTYQQGETVFAFGSPHGVGNSMSKGIVSAGVRQVNESDPTDYIQTDAAINPGNSGGALVDIQGRLVGINTFILSGSGGNEGLNFAVPAGTVFYIYNQLHDNGYVVRGDIGISPRNITAEWVRQLKLPVTYGVYLEDVEPKGPADVAGLKVGDIVVGYSDPFFRVTIDEKTTDPRLGLEREISGTKQGNMVRLDVIRPGASGWTTPKTFNITARQLSKDVSSDGIQLSSDLVIEPLGIFALSIDTTFAKSRGFRSSQGVYVASKVQSMGPVTDLQVGDFIINANGTPVPTSEDLKQLLDKLSSGDRVLLNIERDGRYKIIAVPIN
jgi:serine protease Do